MASMEERTFEIDAANPDEARAKIASQTEVAPGQLEIVATQALKTWPWQPKRFHYKLSMRADAAAQGTPSRDGSFSVELRDGVVWLTLTPPEGAGKPVGLEDLVAETRNWPVDPIEKTALAPIIERATGKPESVAIYGTSGSEGFRVFVSSNAMAAYVICGAQPPEGDRQAQIAAACEADGITYGIDQDATRALLETWTPGAAVVVARGEAPAPGSDAGYEQTFASPTGQAVREDGSVDFFASQLTPAVTAETVLVTKQLATAGTPGHTVRGEVLPTLDGKDLDLKRMVGKGVTVSEDGTEIRAAIDGIPAVSQGKYSVTPSLQIGQDVDFSTGNVNFPGSVVVNGEVQDGFEIRSEGDISIRGTVGAATLEAGGAVALMSGMFGREKGSIVAQGDVKATFLTECTVETPGDVVVQRELVRSTVTAGGSVVLTGGKIIGGTIRAGYQVSAEVIGSPTGRAPTQIVITMETPKGEGRPPEGSGRPSVRVHGTVYPPTRITIGRAQLSIDEDTPYCVFVETNDQIVMLPYA